MTVDATQQVPSQESHETRPAADLVLIILGVLGLLCAFALFLLSTVGQAAARAHPDAEVTGVVVVNGFHASCPALAGGMVMDSECRAAAVRITGSTNTDAFPLDSILTVTAPSDLTIGAPYRGSEQISVLPGVLEILVVPAVIFGFGGMVAIIISIHRRRRRTQVIAAGSECLSVGQMKMSGCG